MKEHCPHKKERKLNFIDTQKAYLITYNGGIEHELASRREASEIYYWLNEPIIGKNQQEKTSRWCYIIQLHC